MRKEIMTIALDAKGLEVTLRMPRFAESDTAECKADIAEIKAMTNVMGNKIAHMLEKYNPSTKEVILGNDDLARALDALHAAIFGDKKENRA